MRVAARTLGEVLVTIGVLLVLFVVWQVGYVGLVDGRAQANQVGALEQQFSGAAGGTDPQQVTAPTDGVPVIDPLASKLSDGSLFAIVRIPRLGADWAKPVYEGVGASVLAKGLGHYPSTGLPGEIGNVAIAGHRAGHGNPLIDIDRIVPGDAMIIETEAGWYVYRAQRHEIVPPTAIQVIDPVPGRPGVTPTERNFTLTSCEPRYGSTNRYIVYSTFDRFVPRSAGAPSELAGG